MGWVQEAGVDAVEAEALGDLYAIANSHAELASTIVSMAWMQDGVDDVEVEAVKYLYYIANVGVELASSVLSLGWVQDSVDDVEATALRWMGNIRNAEVASSVVSLGWMQDGVDDEEVRTIEYVSYIANTDVEFASSVLSLGWMQDGVDDLEAEAVGDLYSIADSHAELASTIVSMGWVQDGVDDLEAKAVKYLYSIENNVGVELASSVLSLGWMQDGVDDLEAEAVKYLYYIANVEAEAVGDLYAIADSHAELASTIVSMAWMQDGVDDVEVEAVKYLYYIANVGVELASSVLSLGWVQDSVDDVEATALRWMGNIRNAEVASSVVSLGWMQDGVDDEEVRTIEYVSYIANTDAEVASSVLSLGWVQDGIDNVEIDLIRSLARIAKKDAGAALRIVGMPFVETIEPPDVSAMTSLKRLAAFEPETFEYVMSHAALRNGISNDLAPMVATLRGVAKTNPGLIDVLLDPARVSLERRTLTLPLSGDVVLSIIRTSPGAARSMDLLEHSVRRVEEYMGSPLPANYVGLLYEDAAPPLSAGANFGTHIAILPKYDIDDGSDEAEFAALSIAHEVAHFYWSGNADWIDEGMAELMASIVENARTGHPVGVDRLPCAHAGNIAELESLSVASDDIEFGCNYSLGERIFLDLYRTLGEERFRQGIRELYLASEIEDDVDDLGIEYVREAFRSGGGAASAVISRWYDGTEPYDLSRLDTGPVSPGLPSIDGRIDAYIAMGTGGPAVSAFSAQDVIDGVYLTLKYSYNVSGGPHEVPLEIAEYYEDGFDFRRRSGTLTAEAQYRGGTSWFSVGPSPPRKWRPGRYFVYVYAGERKVAEVEYEVTPRP